MVKYLRLLLIIELLLGIACATTRTEPCNKKGSQKLPKKEWLREKIVLKDCEAKINLELFFPERKAEWEEFQGMYQNGDEVWYYHSPRESWPWNEQAGCVLVRDGCFIATIEQFLFD